MEEKGMTPAKRFWRLLVSEKKEITNIYIYAIFNGLVMLTVPLGIQAIINLIQSNTYSTAWIVLVVLVIVGLTLAGVFQVFQLMVAERIQQRLFANASMEFAYRIPRIRLSSFKKYYPPELMNRFFDVVSVQKGLYKLLFDFSLASLQILFGLILLSLYHPFFIAFGFVLVISTIFYFRLTSGKGLKTSIEESDHKYQTVSWLEDLSRNLTTFKMAGRTSLPMDKANEFSGKYIESRRAHFKVLLRQYYILIVFKIVIAGGLLLLGGLLVFEESMNIGQFVAAEIVIVQIISSVEKLIYSLETIYDVLTGMEKLGSVTDLELESSNNVHQSELPETGAIGLRVKNVSLKSPQWDRTILSNLNVEIAPGEKVGLTGQMSAGKSTFLQLLAGLYDKYDGKVFYNDVPFENINPESLRSAVGDNLMPQDIFQGTFSENISLGRENIDEKQIQNLIRINGLQNFVEDLPRDIHTDVPPGGMGLSATLRNRILMARALAGDHCIYLLEDNWFEIEDSIRDRWLNYLIDESKLTLIMATNNCNALQRMDRILVMENGTIKESGTFEELKGILPC